LIEAKRVLRPSGNLFVYAIHHHACFLQTHLYDIGMLYRRQIIWNYENGWSKYRNAPACHYEPILWFSHRGDSTFHIIREPYKSQERLKHPITKGGKVWTPHPDGRQAGDVWAFPTLAGRRFSAERTEHPTQKPLSLSRRIVSHFSNPGDLVAVPFVGSGSECVAAIECGRRFIGAELNPSYVDIARERISEASSQLFQVSTEHTDG
jgi:DNA modification methylase